MERSSGVVPSVPSVEKLPDVEDGGINTGEFGLPV